MKPPPFQYHDPATVEEAVQLLSTLENAKLLAGGQSLLPMLNMRFVLPDHIIDLNRVPSLFGIVHDGDAIHIGAMTRQREIEFSDVVRIKCPLMYDAIRHVGHRQTRNRGTIGGSLCHLDPSAEMVLVAAAYNVTLTAVGPYGSREISFRDFPTGYLTSNLAFDEILTSIKIPVWPQNHKYCFTEFSRRHGDFAIVAVAVMIELRDGIIVRSSIAIGGTSSSPARITKIEDALNGNRPDYDLFDSVCEACRDMEAMSDIHATSAYRQHLAEVLLRRALKRACGLSPLR